MPKPQPARYERQCLYDANKAYINKNAKGAQMNKLNLEENVKEASPWIGVVFNYLLHTEENLVNYQLSKSKRNQNSMSIRAKYTLGPKKCNTKSKLGAAKSLSGT